MKILSVYLYHNVEYGMGGSSRGVYELCVGMQAKYGDEVLCISNAGPLADTLLKSKVAFREIPRKRHETLNMLKVIAEEWKRFKPDIVHSNHRYTTFLLDLFFKGKGVPILHTERAQAWDKRWLYRYGDFATAVAPSLRDHLIAYYKVPKDRIRAITNAVDYESPNSQVVEELRKKYPKQEGQVFAACVGRFEEQKGHCYLVEAVSHLPQSYRERFRVLLIGDGNQSKDLTEQMDRLGVRKCFEFLGYHQPISEPLAIADFFVLPSLWEGLPRSMIEAFFGGKPAIATNIPGNFDIVENEVSGLLVPPRDSKALSKAIQRWMDHPEEVAMMGKAALEASKKYQLDRVLTEYHELYEQLIKESCSSKK